jgi:wyosine [tRNA(Phe)-imidazoG37] synthetase (radical SAM superfamily)
MQLPVIQPKPEPPLFVSTSAGVDFAAGFFGEEQDGPYKFRWTELHAILEFAPAAEPRFLECGLMSEFGDLSQVVTITAGSETRVCPLPHGWTPFSIPVPAGVGSAVLRVNKRFPGEYHVGDNRILAIRVRDVRLHADPERHRALALQHDNSTLNQQELLSGQTSLTSTPPSLGIDLHGVCNVKPPCVYCEWDFSKNLEGDRAEVPFTRETLKEWGEFFDNTSTLINCSIGEPFMMKNLNELLEIFGRTGKTVQMTTNGQILTDRNIQNLVGMPIDLYVSLDAATASTYAKLRNNTFDRLVANLKRLVIAKGGRGKMPYIHMVFMPMRCNLHELEDFVKLVAEVGADRLVLRPLNYSEGVALDWERGGHRFVYQEELLPFDELVKASGRAARASKRLGVELADQMDFGGSMRDLFQEDFDADAEPASAPADTPPAAPAPAAVVAAAEPAPAPAPAPQTVAPAPLEPAPVPAMPAALPSIGREKAPACLEPWKSLYILRRGVLPCCYGGAPLAPMEDYRKVWNSPEVQAIRGELLQGRFHDYCLKSPACPIVRKSEHAGLLPMHQRARLQGRHWWGQLNHLTDDRLNQALNAVRRWLGNKGSAKPSRA